MLPARTAAMYLWLLSFVLYGACLFVPAFCLDPWLNPLQPRFGESCWPGWAALALGLPGLLMPTLANLTWLANVLLLGSWLFVWLGMRKTAIALAVGAAGLSMAFLQATSVRRFVADMTPPADFPITERGLGYWLWLASMAAGVASALVCHRSGPKAA